MANKRFYRAKVGAYLGRPLGYIREGDVFEWEGAELSKKNFEQLTTSELLGEGLISADEAKDVVNPVVIRNENPKSIEQQGIEQAIALREGQVPDAPGGVTGTTPQAGVVSADPLNPTVVDAGTAAAAATGNVTLPPSGLPNMNAI